MYIYSGAPFSVTDSKIATYGQLLGSTHPAGGSGGLRAPSAPLQREQCGRSALPAARPTLPLTPARASRPRSRPTGATSHPTASAAPGTSISTRTLQRTFAIKEKFKFVFGMQAYNVLNHPNFANPSGSLTSGSFGQITSTLGPPTSIYGTGQGASVSGRLAVLTGNVYVLKNSDCVHKLGRWSLPPALFFDLLGRPRGSVHARI